jgi:hypothetical protein
MQKPLMSASATEQLINVPAHLAAEAYMTAARAARTLSRQVSDESDARPRSCRRLQGGGEGQAPPRGTPVFSIGCRYGRRTPVSWLG